MQGVAILGSTGSIGVSTLDVIARHPDRFRATVLTAHRNTEKLLEQCAQFQPAHAVIADESLYATFRDELSRVAPGTQAHGGAAALEAVVALDGVDQVMAAIVGAVGLLPTLAAARAGRRVLLANKEALVIAGALFLDAVQAGGAELVPIDSEHNAVFQCLPDNEKRPSAAAAVQRIVLTASGGPFLDTPLEQLATVTPDAACAHPRWVMGRKISVDSATMMNKGLEVIEAAYLFGLPVAQIDVLVHRESIVHSLVEYLDGSTLAQLGQPDMRTPIAQAMAWPQRIASGVRSLDLVEIASLHFEALDPQRFPCLGLARAAFAAGHAAVVRLNAANEVAVQGFLDGRIRYTDIPSLIEEVMAGADTGERCDSLHRLMELDQEARRVAAQRMGRLAA